MKPIKGQEGNQQKPKLIPKFKGNLPGIMGGRPITWEAKQKKFEEIKEFGNLPDTRFTNQNAQEMKKGGIVSKKIISYFTKKLKGPRFKSSNILPVQQFNQMEEEQKGNQSISIKDSKESSDNTKKLLGNSQSNSNGSNSMKAQSYKSSEYRMNHSVEKILDTNTISSISLSPNEIMQNNTSPVNNESKKRKSSNETIFTKKLENQIELNCNRHTTNTHSKRDSFDLEANEELKTAKLFSKPIGLANTYSNKRQKKSEILGKIMKWKKGALLSNGSFSQVYRALEVNTGQIFAVKQIPLTNYNEVGEIDLKDVEVTFLCLNLG